MRTKLLRTYKSNRMRGKQDVDGGILFQTRAVQRTCYKLDWGMLNQILETGT